MDSFLKSLATKIRSLRREKNLIQRELADLAGLSCKYVGMIERAERNPTITVLFRIADTLEVSILELLDLEPDPKWSKKNAKKEMIGRVVRQLNEMDQENLDMVLKISRIIQENTNGK